MAFQSEAAAKKAPLPAQKKRTVRLIVYFMLLKGDTEERTI
ncbi:hypothetical protein [Bordetella hinzii]|nr:hypothetical protein [Bordetella hinzii]AKQ58610.1 hypothetical protein ACR55_00701 [Bordetella hinzii]